MSKLELFLHSLDGADQALVEGLSLSALAESGGESYTPPVISLSHSESEPGLDGDPNSLYDQLWAVITCRGDDGDRLLALVAPLLDKRAEDQEGEVAIYRVAPDMDVTAAARWLRVTFRGNNPLDEIPGYLLILGDFGQVSLALQQVLSTDPDLHVGRLGFSRDADYEAYVAKLLGLERQTPSGMARTLFFTARDGTTATELGQRSLIGPCLADARSGFEAGKFPSDDIIAIRSRGEKARDELLAAAADPRPTLLFSCSHGLGPPRDGWKSPEEQRAMQGALYLGKNQFLSAEMVAERAFLPGGIWLFFACFSAGTPAESPYAHWLRRLTELDEYFGEVDTVLAALPPPGSLPFAAALPQAALANPEGPVAIIGHMDLAWSYGFMAFEDLGDRARYSRFFSPLQTIVRGSRAGLAASALLRVREQAKVDSAIAVDRSERHEMSPDGSEPGLSPDDRVMLGHRWMLHQDIDGYILLGDPAARLAIDPPARRRRRRG